MLSVEGLAVYFPAVGGRRVHAVDGVTFTVERGETLGVVGESGCGKSTMARAILRLVPAQAGRVLFQGQDLLTMPASELRPLRRRLQMVFQDPYASLSPRMTVERILLEPLEIHGVGDRAGRREAVRALLEAVGLPPEVAARYPHEFSGGQRQRIGIARALALEPELIVLDEPVSALDISVRAQVINVLMEIQERRGVAYLLIGHDLSLIRHVAHRVAVMYLGRIVEMGPAERLYANPRHPYTRSLLESAPVPNPERRRTSAPLEGDPPSPIDLPSGCRFRTRCLFAQAQCARDEPALSPIDGSHLAACHRGAELPVWNRS